MTQRRTSRPPAANPKRAASREHRLDRRLLGFLIDSPHDILVRAMATGMAIAQELVHRDKLELLQRLGVNERLCFTACGAALEMWADASRAGGLTEAEFDRLIRNIIRIARSS